MFSGIVEEYAEVVRIEKDQENLHLTLRCSFVDELKIDQSISHNGVCLTVVKIQDGTYTVTAMRETIERSNIGMLKVGDKVNVMIKDIQDTKIALTLKLEENNPWKNAAEKYQIGTVVTGKVARMTDFGAFIELEEGIDALLHVSQIAIEHVEKPSDVLKVGQEITAKIVDFNEETKKISLSVKALEIEKRNEAADVEDSEEE